MQVTLREIILVTAQRTYSRSVAYSRTSTRTSTTSSTGTGPNTTYYLNDYFIAGGKGDPIAWSENTTTGAITIWKHPQHIIETHSGGVTGFVNTNSWLSGGTTVTVGSEMVI